jgi:hypothetical protein
VDQVQEGPGRRRACGSDHKRHRRQKQKAAIRGEIPQPVASGVGTFGVRGRG